MVEIKKDTSGKTYEFKLYNGDKEVLMGDGYEHPDEVMGFVKDLLDSLIAERNAEVYIEVALDEGEQGEDKTFVYTNKMEANKVNENMSTVGYKSSIKEVTVGK